MIKKLGFWWLIPLGLWIAWLALPVNASAPAQSVIPTPTADANGRIYYIIKEGDSCISISMITGVSEDQLRLLNDLKQDCSLVTGQKLLLGVVEQKTATPAATPTPTELPPGVTPQVNTGTICIFLYEDINGNAMVDDSENALGGGKISVTEKQGKYSQTGTTLNDGKPVCFKDIPEGEYIVSVAPLDGYNATTAKDYVLKLRAGDNSSLNFGAQPKGQVAAVTPQAGTSSAGGNSLLLAIVGGGLILGGIGLGVYFIRMRR
jgi:hypothetical protein